MQNRANVAPMLIEIIGAPTRIQQCIWIVLALLLAYALYPTILGWAFLFVPILLWTIFVLVTSLLSPSTYVHWGWPAFFSVSGISLTSAYYLWRPKLASKATVVFAIVIAIVVEGPYVFWDFF